MDDIKQALDVNVSKILAEAQSEMQANVIAAIKRDVEWHVGHELSNNIAPVVKDFVEKEIAPVLREQLLGQKSQILEQVAVQVQPIAEAVAKAILDTMAKNLADTYKCQKIVKAMMGE